MGIHDRDYMKRPSDDDSQRASSPDAKLEAFLSGFLSRHPRFFLVAGLALAVLVVVAIFATKLAGKNQ
jgi:hypothetical protein